MSEKEKTTHSGQNLPEKKQTRLGLYATAQEAYSMWKFNPDHVRIIDVRTPEEYLFVGHAEMARNIPIGFVKYQWNVEKNEPETVLNPDFVTCIKDQYSTTDTLLLICRSGGRSALATNALNEAGFVDVYNVIDGMEGDLVKDPDSAYYGKRMQNGWKNSGLPWTYDVSPELLWIIKE